MATLRIDGVEVEVGDGATILDAAVKAGASIPTMCSVEGLPHFTSCMICAVRDCGTGAFVPSCSAKAANGMEIETGSDEVRQFRRDALELLLSEHVGDCEGPCRMGCPAHMNIPAMLRQVLAGDTSGALVTAREHLVLPKVLSRICPAPCEKVCRRAHHDSALAVRDIVRHVSDGEAASPSCAQKSGKKVAIVGSGPAGLSTAWHLLLMGHDCTIYESQEEPGGMLRYGASRDDLPESVLNEEIDTVRELGATFETSMRVGSDISMSDIRERFDAVVLTVGSVDADDICQFEVDGSAAGIEVVAGSLLTSENGVFAGGNAIRHSHMAARAVGDGMKLAHSVGEFLRGEEVVGFHHRFNSRIGKLREEEMARFLATASGRERASSNDLGSESAKEESARCLHCDCRKSESCALRKFSSEHEAMQSGYKGSTRHSYEQFAQHADVIYEPGKCIKCGACVRITEKMAEPLGLTFVGRGFDVKVGGPFDESLEKSLTVAAEECVAACPTAALSWVGSSE